MYVLPSALCLYVCIYVCLSVLTTDKVGCDGLSNLNNDEEKLNVISFIWSPFRNAILSLKVSLPPPHPGFSGKWMGRPAVSVISYFSIVSLCLEGKLPEYRVCS